MASNSRRDTFQLKFFIDDDCNIGMKMLWVEENSEVILPEHLWPNNPQEIKRVAEIAFPYYSLLLEAERAREITRKFELEQALLKAGLAERQVEVESQTEHNKTYTLTFHANHISCTCHDWVWNRKPYKGKCKHIRKYLEDRIGKETIQRVVPTARMWPNWSLQQLQIAYEHADLLERIVRKKQVNDALMGR